MRGPLFHEAKPLLKSCCHSCHIRWGAGGVNVSNALRRRVAEKGGVTFHLFYFLRRERGKTVGLYKKAETTDMSPSEKPSDWASPTEMG